MAKQKICLLTIDPQNDFVNRDGKGTLGVGGAIGDMDRLANMVRKYGQDIDDIQITLDSHYQNHVAHAIWWVDKKRVHPKPFTLITKDAAEAGDWVATNPALQEWSLNYVRKLAERGRYPLCIWPAHCIIGSVGQCIDPVFYEAVTEWETKFYGIAPRTTKGSNPLTEHYSAVKAEVEDSNDPGTRLNDRLIKTLKTYDVILITGEALSHCVANTVRDIAAEFSDDQVKKFVLLEDAASNVGGFEKMGEDFVNEMVKRGMGIAKTTTFFK